MEIRYIFAVSLRQEFFEKMSTSKLIGILFKFFYEMPRKALSSMAGLDRKVLNSRRITKIMAPSNPVFIGVSSHPLVWLLIIRERDAHSPGIPFLFYGKKHGSSCSVKEKGVNLHRKTD